MADLARLVLEVSGREVRHETITDEAWSAAKGTQGVPAPVAELLLGSSRASRHGDFATVDPTRATRLGRPPRPMRDVLADFLQPTAS